MEQDELFKGMKAIKIPKDKLDKNFLLFTEDLIFFIPIQEDKPVKIFFEENPCPVNPSVRCKHSQFLINDDGITIQCELEKCNA